MLGLVVVLSCGSDETTEATPTGTGSATLTERDCYSCHGDEANSTNAPPPAIFIDDLPETHHRHLEASSWRAWVYCDDCHVVPSEITDEGHNDGLPADLTWGGLALADDADPAYDYDTQTCTGVYCHGATMFEGGTHTVADWANLDGTQIECGSCHGMPPGRPHPEGDLCVDCHQDVVDENNEIVAPILHIDGVVSADDLECNECHGGGDDPALPVNQAPPVDTWGNTDTTAPGVGAHQQHLADSDWRAPITCDQCHVVPIEMMDDGHLGSDPPADLTWGALATADGAAPQYDATSHTCTDSYCHGATLEPSGSNTAPVWTVVDGSQDACGTCHGAPPSAPEHPYVRVPTDCGPCHPYTGLDPDDHLTHVDGVVDLVEPLACNVCHGGSSSDAPPLGVTGQSSTADPGVGAHQSMLSTSLTTSMTCVDCHQLPTLWNDVGHYDSDLPAEINFSGRAQLNAMVPVYSRPTCSNTYCHEPNALDTAATKGVPVWTTVDGTYSACGSCHGYPPVHALHLLGTDCYTCHYMVVGADHTTIIDQSLHINGTVDADFY
jgi:predicted CxxxxCH...CXXCH cytochrome family protein